MSELTPFYVILRDDDDRLKRQPTYHVACDEAKRLARQHPEHAFVVVQTIQAVGPIQPKAALRNFVPKDGFDAIPF